MMAADSDGCSVTTVVTCEGDLSDPNFEDQFGLVLNKLGNLLGDTLKVHKLEPWNSVRVTLSIPREAALRLRQLASDGSQQLRALGILSVQVEGDQVISLRLAGSVTTEPQEIILQTGQDATPGPSSASDANLSQLFQGNSQVSDTTIPGEKVQFRSPNVVCPSDSIVPKVPISSTPSNTAPSSTKSYVGPFPFTSMNQAMQSRDNLGTSTNYNNPPPPYPGKHQSVNISSPLLVNLLQTDGVQSPKQNETDITNSISNGLSGNSTHVSPSYTQGATVKSSKQPTIFVQKPVQSVRSVKPQHSVCPQTSAGSILHQTVSSVNIPQQQSPLVKPIPRSPIPSVPSKLVANSQSKSTSTHNVVTQTLSAPVCRPNPVVNNLNLKPSLSIFSTNHSISSQQKVDNLQSSAQKPVTVNNNNNNNNNRAVPYRSYPTFTNSWDQPQMPQIQELTPTLTDLKADLDLDHLLPSLDLVGSPPEIPEELTNVRGRPTYLINPLTGELEPQSSHESEDEEPSDVFTDLPSPSTMSDEDTNSTTRPDTTDQSDSESRSCHSDSGKYKYKRNREKGRDSPNLKQEKIKLRLKLEKSEPVSPAYKVDVSFINTQQPKKAVPGEELRVPPLHISLRGRNHAVINNKKKLKMNPDGSPLKSKVRKVQDHAKIKKDEHLANGVDVALNMVERLKNHVGEIQKLKKPKLNHEHREKLVQSDVTIDYKNDLAVFNTFFKEKLKERRGSDSELARANKKHGESNGILSVDKKRRLSQTEERNHESQASILGSTNTGTVSALSAHKVRKDKLKLKDNFKCKDLNRHKSYSKNVAEKLAKQVPLPTGDLDMEAKFKQRLLEEPERIVPKIPHRTETAHQDTSVLESAGKVADLIHTLTDPVEVKDKPPEPDKCNTPERKPDLTEKQPNRSPNSGGQGEDSGIESMDALSEKSPNQASQSPHAEIQDTLKPKTQVPDILDIEAQLAKMEGFTGDDLNETNHNNQTKEQCCGLTSSLQDSLKDTGASTTLNDQLPQVEVSLVPLKTKSKEEDLDPLPIRVTPPLYTYSNPEKGRAESPTSDDPDSNNCGIAKSKSLLEQLLIDIPENQTPSSPSPAARSVRTRASSKLNSPELNSPVMSKQNKIPPTTKRKRHESDSSNNSLEDTRNKKPRKSLDNAAELNKSCINVDPNSKVGITTGAAITTNNTTATASSTTNITTATAKKKATEESSDSDEPLIEIAGKVRKSSSQVASTNASNSVSTPRTKIKPLPNNGGGGGGGGGVVTTGGLVKALPVNTRRSVRTIPALNTRSKGDKSQPDADILRRKTRSAVSEGEGKRRKDVK